MREPLRPRRGPSGAVVLGAAALGAAALATLGARAAASVGRAAVATSSASSAAGDGPLTRPTSAFMVRRMGMDGRCMFRSIAAGGAVEPQSDNTAAADALRRMVIAELQRRREEVEWSLEEPFASYLQRMARPATWGGEPELLMASHVLRRPLWVWMPGELVDQSRHAGSLVRSASYGEEYGTLAALHLLYTGSHYDLLMPQTMSKL